MVFSSIIFLLYFLPIFLLIYFVCPDRWKNATALMGSLLFYAWGEPTFILLILLLLVLDFYLVRLLYYAEGKLKKKLLSIVIFLNVANLLVFKYLMFIAENVNVILGALNPDAYWKVYIALPIGISFITFQKISYALDVSRQIRKPMERFVDYGLYIMFFPQLIAGPIIRYHEIADQIIDRRKQQNIDNKLQGFFRFILGLSKKVLIANPLGVFVDEVFVSIPNGIGMGYAWLGIIAYSFQIYFDFSGYSDMAIGIARMLGFRFPENFHFPYVAQSITEFWRRWHITLSKWMRDYLYIPLGGNRISTRRTYVNLWVVFFISGLWHGAAWTFVIWGLFHGAFLVMERMFLQEFTANWSKGLRILFTYCIVLMAWVFFRAESLSDALVYLGQMFSFTPSQSLIQIDSYEITLLIIAAVIAFAGVLPSIDRKLEQGFSGRDTLLHYFLKSILTILFGFYCILELYGSDFNPFIYFRF